MSIDIITYENNGEMPWYVKHCVKDKIKNGFNVLPLTPDSYDCPPYHAGYKHFRDITMPKLLHIEAKGIFICEGDVLLKKGWNIHNIPQEPFPVWYGYKKILKNYIVGNFLIWIPRSYYHIIKGELDRKNNRLIFSDRFFSQLVAKGILKVYTESIADEITHHSNVINDIRKGCDIPTDF